MKDESMRTTAATRRLPAIVLAAALACTFAGGAQAQQATGAPDGYPRESMVTVTGSATMSVANDRLRATLRAEAEHSSAATAAAEVNAKIAKALARAKAYAAITPSTSGYSSYQISERDRPARWRVAQSLSLDSRDFSAMTDLITALQSDGGLVLSGIGFSVSEEAQRQAEDRLTQQAIRTWQERAARAAQALGFPGWRPGHVAVQAGSESRPPYPMMRASADRALPSAAPPVAFEAGTSEVTVTVSGEAVLEAPRRPQAR